MSTNSNVTTNSSNANNTSSRATATNNTYANTTSNPSNLIQIMDNISNNVNPKTMQEGIQLINKPDELIARLQSGADQFQAQTGRQMTYSEMRQMFG
uniref:Uncharacterized protein n=1 Tax=viral metagenome TaxID=1070528 RepID=A0A6C0I7D8_9ZZZZ